MSAPAAGGATAGASDRSWRSAMSASFHSRRSTCQLPSASRASHASPTRNVEKTLARKRWRPMRNSKALPGRIVVFGAVLELQRHQERLQKPQEIERQADE